MVLFLKILGSILVICGCFLLGINIGQGMNKRLSELKELERIIGMLEGELRYRRNPLRQCFENISMRCSAPFAEWLNHIVDQMKICKNNFLDIWNMGMDRLRIVKREGRLNLKNEDIDEIKHIGNALMEEDLDSQLGALLLEKAALHNKIIGCTEEIQGKKKVAVSMCGLGGIMIVIILAI